MRLSRRRTPALEVAPLLRRPLWPRLTLGVAAVVAAGVIAGALGPVHIPIDAVVRIVLSRLPGVSLEGDWPASWEAIVWEVRLPRVVMAGVVGATLAFSGAAYQGIFRNPLADPYLIGVAAGAGLGATVVIVAAVPYTFHGFSLLPLAAFLGALAAVSLAYGLARAGRAVPVTTLILAGVAISSIATAITSFLMLTNTERTLAILFWLLGGLGASAWDRVGLLLPYVVPTLVVVLAHGRILNVLQLDEEQARQLGVDVERAKVVLLGAASLATAAAVSLTGIIGFVGLIVPHAARLLWGPDYRHLVPMSALLGAAFLVTADLLARTVIAPAELPVGIVTAIAGAPFFLYLLRRQRQRIIM